MTTFGKQDRFYHVRKWSEAHKFNIWPHCMQGTCTNTAWNNNLFYLNRIKLENSVRTDNPWEINTVIFVQHGHRGICICIFLHGCIYPRDLRGLGLQPLRSQKRPKCKKRFEYGMIYDSSYYLPYIWWHLHLHIFTRAFVCCIYLRDLRGLGLQPLRSQKRPKRKTRFEYGMIYDSSYYLPYIWWDWFGAQVVKGKLDELEDLMVIIVGGFALCAKFVCLGFRLNKFPPVYHH